MTHFKNYFKGRLSCKFCYKLLVKDPTIPKSPHTFRVVVVFLTFIFHKVL